jgi:ubiquinone/menaquinone biosynthesis C-methylase UbiE
VSIWGHIFAAIYDRMSEKSEQAGIGEHRRSLLAAATGDVLEIGGGTGANLPYYGTGVSSLTITEPERPMAKRLRPRMEAQAPDAMFLRAPAEDLPFSDSSFDVVVSTLVLCTVDDQPRALRELRRVLRPGGKLLFIEHVRSEDEQLARRQDRMAPINLRIAHGCHCNRSTLDGIRDAGFTVTDVGHDTIKHVPSFLSPLIVGVANVEQPTSEPASRLSSTREAER